MQVKKGLKLRTVGREYIITGEGLDQLNFNKLISLNSSAAYLWKEIEEKKFDIQTLADLLVSQYNIAVDQALMDAADLTKSWIDAGIVEE